MLERGVVVAIVPDGKHFLCLSLPLQRAEGNVVHAFQLADAVFRHDGDGLFGGDHHNDALIVTGAQQDVGLIAGILVELDVIGIAKGVAGAGGGHEENAFSFQILPGESFAAGEGVTGVHGYIERDILRVADLQMLLLADVGTVPGEDDVVFLVQKS